MELIVADDESKPDVGRRKIEKLVVEDLGNVTGFSNFEPQITGKWLALLKKIAPGVFEHPFGTIKMRIGATHFLCNTLPKVATEMALCVMTYNFTRVLNIVGVKTMMEAIAA